MCVDELGADAHASPYDLFTYHVSSNTLVVVSMSMQVFVLLSPKYYGPVSIHAGQTSLTQHSSYTAMREDMRSALRSVTDRIKFWHSAKTRVFSYVLSLRLSRLRK